MSLRSDLPWCMPSKEGSIYLQYLMEEENNADFKKSALNIAIYFWGQVYYAFVLVWM